MKSKQHNLIIQFKIALLDIEPAIWRRIQVPATYSFWDLHIAIQDSMGWLDYHLHEFRLRKPRSKKEIRIGIPDEDEEDNTLPGWDLSISDYFTEPGQVALYEYDFGDSWEHELLFEGILLRDKNINYPGCAEGERACPPEDCGSVPGYYRLLEILKNPTHEEYSEMVKWLEGFSKNSQPYDPEEFSPENVQFDDPGKRWKNAFM